MEAVVESPTLVRKIKDERFNVEYLSQYHLLIQLTQKTFRLCVTDSLDNRCLALEEYAFEFAITSDQLLSQLNAVYDGHHFLKAGYWKSIRITYKNDKFTLVPNSLFIEENAKEYLRLNCDVHSIFDQVSFYKHRGNEIVNIFSADRKIMDWFRGVYQSKKIDAIHHTSACIEGILKNVKEETGKVLFVNVEATQLTVLCKRERKLDFCNIFPFQAPDDAIYFIMAVLDALKMNPDENTVYLVGDIEHNSEIYLKLCDFVKNVKFGEKPSSMFFGYVFDEVFDHKYFDLYSMHLCE